jgi:hypothetical protein
MCDGQGQIQGQAGRRPAWYTIQLLANSTAPATTSVTGSIQILASEDFEWQFVMATYTDARLLITVIDNSSGKPLVIAPNQNSNAGIVPIALFAGNAQLPFPIRPSYRMPKNNTLTIIITDQSGANNTLNLALYGNSVIEQGPAQTKAA